MLAFSRSQRINAIARALCGRSRSGAAAAAAAGPRSLLDHSFFQPIHNVFQTSGPLCVPVALLPVGTVTFCITRLVVRCQTPCTNSKITSTYIFCVMSQVPVQTLDKFALIFVWCKQRTCPVAYLSIDHEWLRNNHKPKSKLKKCCISDPISKDS